MQVGRLDVPHALLAEVARRGSKRSATVAVVVCVAAAACSAGDGGSAEPLVPTVELPAAASAIEQPVASAEAIEGKRPVADVGAITWHPSLERGLELAARDRRALLIFVHADWSVASVRVEREAFADERVRRATRAFVAVRLDVTETSAENEQRSARLGVDRLPSVLLLDSRGVRLDAIEGAADADALLELMAGAQR